MGIVVAALLVVPLTIGCALLFCYRTFQRSFLLWAGSAFTIPVGIRRHLPDQYRQLRGRCGLSLRRTIPVVKAGG